MFALRRGTYGKMSTLVIPALLAVLLSACGPSTTVTPTAAPAAASEPTALPEPTAVPPSPTPDSLVSKIDDVEQAVIYLEVDGGIVEFGETTASSSAGSGSGFIIDPSGIAVTNNHVVTGAATIKAHIGGTSKDAEGVDVRVLAVSECSDLAVIQLVGDGPYPYLEWYEGEVKNLLDVVAFGFPLFAESIDTTRGSITQLNVDGQSNWASLSSVLEHDARTNPGSSGGPLVTEDGKVVGVNYAGDSKTNQYFAIGGDEVRDLIEQLKQGEDDTSLGLNGEAFVDEDISGIWVRSIKPGSPASKAGVKPGDVITSMYSTPMGEDGTMEKYCQVLRSHPGEAVNLEVVRLSTNERLEGEINSENAGLAVVETLEAPVEEPDPAAATSDYSEYQTITHDTGAISVDVPVEWTVVSTDGTWSFNEEEIGVELGAAVSNEGFQDWTQPGVYIAVSRSLGETTTPDQLLDNYQFTDTCTSNAREDYDDNVYTGRYDYWSACDGKTTELYVVAFTPADTSFLGVLQVQVVGEADQVALERIIKSFQAKGDF
ncbi:MAG: trypsin-like peptidase domain-containing protein [Roseiflexaceae bacterium]|nr:trypsin-like peptidase domain-containing protein [Roseiflexaceae bacterium]